MFSIANLNPWGVLCPLQNSFHQVPCSSRWHLTPSSVSKKRRLLVLKLHTLSDHTLQILFCTSLSKQFLLPWSDTSNQPSLRCEALQFPTNWHVESSMSSSRLTTLHTSLHKNKYNPACWDGFPQKGLLRCPCCTVTRPFCFYSVNCTCAHFTHVSMWLCGKNFRKWLFWKNQWLHYGQKVQSTYECIPWHIALPDVDTFLLK